MIQHIPTSGLTLGICRQGNVFIRPRRTVRGVQEVVASFYGIDTLEMASARRTRSVAMARQIAMYLARKTTLKSFPDIGRFFNRDHTTVMHACNKVESLMATDDDFAVDVGVLRDRLAA
jgi:chromosomal replication initiator protein